MVICARGCLCCGDLAAWCADNWGIGMGRRGLGVFCGVLGAANEKRPFLSGCSVFGESGMVKSAVRSMISSGSFDKSLLISLLGVLVVGIAVLVLSSVLVVLFGVFFVAFLGVGEVDFMGVSLGGVDLVGDLVGARVGLVEFVGFCGGVCLLDKLLVCGRCGVSLLLNLFVGVPEIRLDPREGKGVVRGRKEDAYLSASHLMI